VKIITSTLTLKSFRGKKIESLTAEEAGQFLGSQTRNKATLTPRLKYSQVKAFFRFLINAGTSAVIIFMMSYFFKFLSSLLIDSILNIENRIRNGL